MKKPLSDSPEDVVPSERSGVGQSFLLFFVSIALILTLGVASQLVQPVLGLAVTLFVCILLPAVVFVRCKGVELGSAFRISPTPPGLIWLSAFAGVGTWGVAMLLYLAAKSVLGTPASSGSGVEGVWGYAVMLGVAALLPGVCEECLFRGVIQGVLERKGSWFAILTTGVLFGLFHLDPWRIVPAAVMGCVFGWLVVRSGSLLPAIMAHAANNTMAVTITFLAGPSLPVWLLVVAALACPLSLAAFAKRSPLEPARGPLADVPAGVPLWLAWVLSVCGFILLCGVVALTAAVAYL